MTELEFCNRIAFREYPAPIAALVLNELVGAALLLIGIGTIAPFLAGLLGGSGVPPGPLEDVFGWLGVLAWTPAEMVVFLTGVVALRILLDAVRRSIAAGIGVHLNRAIKKRMNDSMADGDWEQFLNVDQGRYMQCMVAESSLARGAVDDFAAAFGAGFLTLLLLGWLALYSTATFAMFVLASVLFLITNRRLLRALKHISERRIELMSQMNTRVTDTRHVFKFLFAEGLIGSMGAAIAAVIESIAIVEWRQLLISIAVNHYVLLFGLVLVATVSMAHLLFHGTEGSALLFDLVLIQRISSYFGDFQMRRAAMIQKIPSYAACLDMMRPSRVPRGGTCGIGAVATLEAGIAVERVSFSFKSRRLALKNVTFQLPARGLVFFAGPSGSGKTTMVDIILHLLKPERGGRVLVDGRELDELDEARWRQLVAYVPQDAYILSGTLREYLTFGCADIGDGRIWEALDRAGVSVLVCALAQGLDTAVGSGGSDFSGGERQRLSIARALVRDAKMLVLDEPSSALDDKTERVLFESLRTLSARMLIVVVTHSVNAIRATDHLYQFSNGTVLRRGV